MTGRPADRELLLALLDHAPTMLFLMDGEMTVRWANAPCVEQFGYPLDEIVGRNVLDFVDVEWDPVALESIATALGTEGPRPPMLFRGIRADGSKPVIEVWANAQLQHPVLGGLVVGVRRWDERYLLDQTLEAMAASKPLDETLRLLVRIAEADTLDAHAAVLHDRIGVRFAGVVASDELPSELHGPTVEVPSEVAAAWKDITSVEEHVVLNLEDLPPPLRAPAEDAGYRSLWFWPSTPQHDRPAEVGVIVWRREPHRDTDQSRRQAVARLARVGGLVLERMRNDERTLAAVLFTDIVDSTSSALRLGDVVWRRVLEGHDVIVRQALSQCAGREVKHTGDGFLALFGSPALAVRCALHVAAAVRDLGIEIRAGVHLGEVHQHGDDIVGVGVHIGARVAALAGPSQVLVTRTVKDVVADAGLVMVDCGEHDLRGVPEPWLLYEAAVADA